MLQELNILLYQFYNPSWAARNIFKIRFCGGIELATSRRYPYLSFSIVQNCGWLWHDKNHSNTILHFLKGTVRMKKNIIMQNTVLDFCKFFLSAAVWCDQFRTCPGSCSPFEIETLMCMHAAILLPPTSRTPISKVTSNFILNRLTKYKVFCTFKCGLKLWVWIATKIKMTTSNVDIHCHEI